MNDQSTYEQYYQTWIKTHLNKILLFSFIAISTGFIIEIRHYIQYQHQEKAQVLFEDYLDTAQQKNLTLLKKHYPKHVQTHLSLLMNAKDTYEENNIDQTIDNFEFILQHSKHAAIRYITTHRLASVYKQQGELEHSRRLLASIQNPDAYTQALLALSTEDSAERDALLDKASIHASPYIKRLLAVIQHDMITQ